MTTPPLSGTTTSLRRFIAGQFPHKEIDECANKMEQRNHQHPNQLVVAFGRFVFGTINQHPYPKCRAKKPHASEEQKEQQLNIPNPTIAITIQAFL
jgi:hypothetical protein